MIDWTDVENGLRRSLGCAEGRRGHGGRLTITIVTLNSAPTLALNVHATPVNGAIDSHHRISSYFRRFQPLAGHRTNCVLINVRYAKIRDIVFLTSIMVFGLFGRSEVSYGHVREE